jgi:thiamine biosynthesis lipoprotein
VTLAAFAATAIAGGCASRLARFEYRQIHMGVGARVVLYAEDEAAARRAAHAAYARLAKVDDVMSDWRPDSELMRLCARAGEGPVPVSGDLFRVLERSAEFALASDGTFDVTVGPIVRLWRDARRDGRLPDAEALRAARSLVGPQRMVLDAEARTVQLDRPGMQLDLGAIGKGFAADEALAALRSAGAPRALVQLGGDIAVGDAPPGKRGWTIDVEEGVTPGPKGRLGPFSRCGISVSGDAEQFVEIGGVRYSHVVDPRTGLGLTSGLAVTVIAPDATTSDALATAASVLGAERGRLLVARFPGCRAQLGAGASTAR